MDWSNLAGSRPAGYTRCFLLSTFLLALEGPFIRLHKGTAAAAALRFFKGAVAAAFFVGCYYDTTRPYI